MTFKVKWPSNAQNRDMGFYYRDGVDLGGFNLPEVNLDTGSSPNIFTLEGTALRYSDTAFPGLDLFSKNSPRNM